MTGCLSQRYPKELATEMPEVDQFIGTDEVGSIVKAIAGTITRLAVTDTPAYLYDDAAPRRRSQAAHSAYIKIAEGCDRPCAFCIIPKLRGPQRSRAPESVVREARDLVAGGTREICLIAQDLTTYGTDLRGVKQASGPSDEAGAPRLASLLRDLGAVEGLAWIRLHYAYPTACSDELLDVIAAEPRVASYLDVPIQHVDSDVLKAMRRGYGEKQVRDLVARFRARVPGAPYARRSSPAIRAKPTPPSSGCAISSARASWTTSAYSTSRARKGRSRRCCRSACRRRKSTHAAGSCSASSASVEEEAGRDARPRAARACRRAVGRDRVPVDGTPRRASARIDGQVYLSLPPDVAAPAPGCFVNARVTHSAEYDLAAELAA